jgi:hypothetical protein
MARNILGERIAQEGFNANNNLPRLKQVQFTINNEKRRNKKSDKQANTLNLDSEIGNFIKFDHILKDINHDIRSPLPNWYIYLVIKKVFNLSYLKYHVFFCLSKSFHSFEHFS